MNLQRGELELVELQPKPADVMRRHDEHSRHTETMSAAAWSCQYPSPGTTVVLLDILIIFPFPCFVFHITVG